MHRTTKSVFDLLVIYRYRAIRITGFSFLMHILILSSCESGIDPHQIYNSANRHYTKFDNDSAAAALKQFYLSNKGQEKKFDRNESGSREVTFSEVSLLFQRYCLACHNQTGQAPFSFTKYGSIKKRAKAIEEALETLIMPPWCADENYSTFCNTQSMSDQDRSTILAWIEGGCRLGDSNAEEITTYSTPLEPDLLVTTPEHHTISSDTNTYACFVFDPEFESDTFVDCIQYFSDNPSTLHHLTLFADTNGLLDGKPNCWLCTYDESVYGLVLMDGWVKSQHALRFSPNVGHRFPKQTKFLLQAHYESNFRGTKEKTSLGFNFIAKPAMEIKWLGLNNLDIVIPANKIMTQSIVHELREPMLVVGLTPHLHFVCKTIEVFAITPNSIKIPLLFIPNWDYMLTTKYILTHPVLLPEGSVIYANAVFDNTEGNPVQPNDPVRDVTYKISSYDEMFVVSLFYASGHDSDVDCVAKILK
jgi:hypothetical protein